jgi:formate dehydrogenase subunit gamma
MASAMNQPDSVARSNRLLRFGAVERAVHWANAALFLFLIVTGFSLYGWPGFRWIGYRGAVKDLHLWVGYALPVPVVIAVLTRGGAQFRDDCRRFARWTIDDSRWWRAKTRPLAKVGKFNPGQKLNAVFIGACIVVFPITGTAMRWANVFPLWMRRGADFTHSWFAIALFPIVVGHIVMALARPEAMQAILNGHVDPAWAAHEHPRWHAEMTEATPPVALPASSPMVHETVQEEISSGDVGASS